MRVMHFLLISLFVLISGCFNTNAPTSSASPVSHEAWNMLLKKYVNTYGQVNYKAWAKDTVGLSKYVEMLSKNAPNEKTWTHSEQLAYWLNAYNAFTIQLVLRYYPLKSIKDIVKLNIPFVNSPWDIKFITISGKKFDLNDIEHGIIRKKFDEPRIHFALVCAAVSCPQLRNEAYTAELLDKQLNDQAYCFINDPKKNVITTNRASLSSIFLWYGSDFTQKMPLQSYINQYAITKMNLDTKPSYLDYNWNLNQ